MRLRWLLPAVLLLALAWPVEGGHYFSEGLVSASLGVGGGAAKHYDARAIIVGSVGASGRFVSLDVGVRPGSTVRQTSLALMFDVPAGLVWMSNCWAIRGGPSCGRD